MARYNYNLKNTEILDNIRSPWIYEFNMAKHLALLSNDSAVVRYFYQIDAPKLCKDQWIRMQVTDKFMGTYIPGQAFVYFGLCPMIVQGKVNLLASNGFNSSSGDKEIDDKLDEFIKDADLFHKFAEGVYLESGLGDFLYRLSYNPRISDKPIIDVIEPQHFEVNYHCGKIKSFVIKVASAEDRNCELREIYYKNEHNQVCLAYRFFYDGKYVAPNDTNLVELCKMFFSPDINLEERILPFDDYPLVFKKNTNSSNLYLGERGVPDIQGLDTIEDGLTEAISDLVDGIRKGGIKLYVNEELIPQTEDGKDLRFNQFNKTVVVTKGSGNPANHEDLLKVVQADIRWESYVRTIQNLMSVGINKAGLSPTTIGLTGLESINSSAESQDAREKTSLRTRELCLLDWGDTLAELLNKYLQMLDYINDDEILDYRDLIKIHFHDYTTPSVENVTEVLARQVQAGLKSKAHAIKDLNEEYTDEDAEQELLDIMTESQGLPVLPNQEPQANDNGNNEVNQDVSGNDMEYKTPIKS